MLRVRSQIHQDRTVNEVQGATADADAAKELVFTIENTVKDVTLSQIVCDSHEGGLVDDRQRSIRQRLPQVVWGIRSGANRRFSPTPRHGRTLQDYGKRQI